MKKVISAILSGVLSSIMLTASVAGVSAADKKTNTEIIQQGTVLHCFVWSFDDIKKELPNISKAGFTAVQTSPVQLSFYGGNWSIYYSPLGFTVNEESALGTKDELRELCKEAEGYGIKVIVDVVANHLAPVKLYYYEEGLDRYMNYMGFNEKYLDDSFWHNKGSIKSYYDRTQITSGDMHAYLPDLNTENNELQADIKALIDELKDMGVSGIRWDAAKHIALPSEGSEFWKNVPDNEMYNYGEILGGPTNDNKSDYLMKEYSDYMSVTDSAYGASVMNMFKNKKVGATDGNWINRGISSDRLMYWAETHDTYCTDGTTLNVSQNAIDRAYAIVASREGASALYFSRPSAENESEAETGAKGSTHFSSPEVSAVNQFHNAMIGKADSYATGGNCAVVTREGGGAVLALGDGSGDVNVPNAGGYVPEGYYTDEITGNIFTVTKKEITGKIGESGIAVIYRRAEVPTTSAAVISTTQEPTATASQTTSQAASQTTSQPTRFHASGTSSSTPKSGGAIPTGSGNTGSIAAIAVCSAASLFAALLLRRKR